MSQHYSNSAMEKLYYELKPVILVVLAFMGLRSGYSEVFLVKLNILMLFILAAHIGYSRLLYRGVIKK